MSFRLPPVRISLDASAATWRRFRRYLADENVPDVAFWFLEAVEESVNQVLAMPEAGTPKLLKNPALTGLRSWRVTGFEDVRIYYLVDGERLRVIRVLHGKQDITRILEEDTSAESEL